ncbi:MAG: SLC13 family permease [Tunicatimonas sp.]|uniref:SLC13 family permease n=1 Tax=Tunicatimonas sp. TaxID=1940096 RepID=UPI003C7128F1
MSTQKIAGLSAGILLFLLILLMPTPEGMTITAQRAAAVALLMAAWWVTEAIPIYVTAFVPVALFPLLGILSADQTTHNYGNNYVLMLLAGFFIAKAIELQNLHKRIALEIIKLFGTSYRRIILSFMVATAVLSMWITNVAVVLLMLPIALALIKQNEERRATDTSDNFNLALMLGIAYAASIGGTATLIGTPPNLVLVGIIEKLFPGAPEISFFDWMRVGIPLVLIFLPVIWLYLIRYFRIQGNFPNGRDVIIRELQSLGNMQSGEQRVLVIFILVALGWIFRRDLVIGNIVIPGWSALLGEYASYAHDSTVAMIGALLLFMIPSGKWANSAPLLNWKSAKTIPWGVTMIVGGGYAIAESFQVTGLADWIGQQLVFINQFPMLIILLLVVSLMIFLTEINSNTATANIFLPVLAALAIASQINPLLLMIPTTFACSFAFMLPSGTGTNAVIFASERVSLTQMARCGLWLNLICVVLLTITLFLIVVPLMDLQPQLPDWAQ